MVAGARSDRLHTAGQALVLKIHFFSQEAGTPRETEKLPSVERPLPRLRFLRDDSPIQIRNLGLFGIRPGLPTLLKKIEGFFDTWSQNVNRLEGPDHSSTHIDQIALLLA